MCTVCPSRADSTLPYSPQLALKTVNGARSAYACFVFVRPFFLSYNDGLRGGRKGGKTVEGEDTGREGGEPLKCKINIKVRVVL